MWHLSHLREEQRRHILIDRGYVKVTVLDIPERQEDEHEAEQLISHSYTAVVVSNRQDVNEAEDQLRSEIAAQKESHKEATASTASTAWLGILSVEGILLTPVTASLIPVIVIVLCWGWQGGA
jgi:hypothetical protein